MKLRRVDRFELVLVAYDSPDDKRRRHIAQLLEGFGFRLQWSVFECWILPGERPRFISLLAHLADESADKLAIIPLNETTRAQTRHIGATGWQHPPPFRLIGDFEPYNPPASQPPPQP